MEPMDGDGIPMTKSERQTVEWAVRELMKDDGDFHGAVGRLARMVGFRLEAFERLEGKDLSTIGYSEIYTIPPGPFGMTP